MSSLAIFSLLLLASAWAQSNHAIHGWEYFGCVETSADLFETTVAFDGGYTPELCQSVCVGFKYTATFVDACRCGNGIYTNKQEETTCNVPCNGDPARGFCGISLQDGCTNANLYVACDVVPPMAPSNPQPISLSATSSLSAPVSTTSCTEGKDYLPPESPSASLPALTPAAGTSVVVVFTTAQPQPSCSDCPGNPTEAGVSYTIPPFVNPETSSNTSPSVSVPVPGADTSVTTIAPSSATDRTTTSLGNGTAVVPWVTAATTTLTKMDGDPPLPTTTSIPARGGASHIDDALSGLLVVAIAAVVGAVAL